MADIALSNEELPLEAAEGKSLPEAIRDKYFSAEPLSGMILGQVEIVSNMPFVKDSDSGAVRLPPCLALNYCCIVGAGDAGEVGTLCKGVKELDLAENSLSDWREVLAITDQIPQLQFLNLSSNPLSTDIPPELAPIPPMDGMTSLVLNNTKIPWDSLHLLLDSTPLLEQLHLSLNNYGTVNSASKTYPTVKLLQFNRNGITAWTDVTKLGQMFPNLESFFMSQNDITGLTKSVGDHFPNLKSLCISETGLASWEEIDALNAFPMITDLRLKRIPLLDSYSEKERHQLVIARLMRRVVRLNGSRIAEKERDEAERAFIRYYMNKDSKPDRYHELVATHGKLDPLAVVDLRPKTSFTCLVHFEDKAKLFDVVAKQTCGQFKEKLKDFVGLPPSKFHLYHVDPVDPGGPIHLRYLSRFLYACNVKDGDEFYIYPK